MDTSAVSLSLAEYQKIRLQEVAISKEFKKIIEPDILLS